MAYVDILWRYRCRGTGAVPVFGRALINVTSGGNATVIAAPGVGLKIMVLDGEVTAAGAGTWSPYHTVVNASNLLSQTQATSNNKQCKVGPWELPENTPFVVAAATQALAGWCGYAIVPV